MKRQTDEEEERGNEREEREREKGGEGEEEERKEGEEGKDEICEAAKRTLQRRNRQQLRPVKTNTCGIPKPTNMCATLDALKVRKIAKEICTDRSIDMLKSPEHYKFIGTSVRVFLEGDTENMSAVSPSTGKRTKVCWCWVLVFVLCWCWC